MLQPKGIRWGIIGCLLIMVSLTYEVWAKEPEFIQEIARTQTYDVVVCGAEPEGIAAAIAASRNGLKTLLIDKRSYPGGLYTAGMLAMLDLNYDDGVEALPVVNQGLFTRMYQSIGLDGGIDIEETKQYFTKLLANNQVDVMYNVSQIQTKVTEGIIGEITFQNQGEKVIVEAQYVIDAMVDAPIARMSGADYWLGREDLGLDEYACATLVFSVKGVDWNKVCHHLANDQNVNSGYSSYTAWGYKELLSYKPVTSSTSYQLRGLNLALQKDGSVVINAFQVVSVDALDEKTQLEAYELAKKEIPYIVSYLREKAVGFEKAELDKIADELYLREGVRIVGEQTLTAEDYFTNKDFDNKIAYGSYPIDLQSVRVDQAGGNSLSGRNVYTIPMGIMLPTRLDNVLVVGRSASYDSIVHGSARTVPVGIALGEAAGEACALSLESGIDLKTISSTKTHYQALQKRLIAQGVTLNDPIKASNEEVKNWSYAAIQNLRRQGVLSKLYNGKVGYGCNEIATYQTFGRIASLAVFHSELPIHTLGEMQTLKNAITETEIIAIVNKVIGSTHKDLLTLYEEGILSKQTYLIVADTKQFYNSHAYAIMSDVINYLREQVPLPSHAQLIHNDC